MDDTATASALSLFSGVFIIYHGRESMLPWVRHRMQVLEYIYIYIQLIFFWPIFESKRRYRRGTAEVEICPLENVRPSTAAAHKYLPIITVAMKVAAILVVALAIATTAYGRLLELHAITTLNLTAPLPSTPK